MTLLSHEESQGIKWRATVKPRGHPAQRPLDEENVPPNLDYKALEKIADGVEKMILSWSNRDEREAYRPPSMTKQGLESGTSLPGAVARGLQKQGQTSSPAIKNPLSEKTFVQDGGCNYMCPVQIQECPGGLTTEISITGKCTPAGTGSSISQIVRAESITNKDTHAEKSVTKTATYWYMESSNGNSPGCQAKSRDEEEQAETTGRIDGFRSTFNQSCSNDKGTGLTHRSKDETDVRSVPRSELDERRLSPGTEAGESPFVAPDALHVETELKSSNRRGTRHSRKKETDLSKQDAISDQRTNFTSNKSAKLKQESEVQSRVLQKHIKLKNEASEVPPLPKVNMGNIESIFDSIVIDDELLEKKLAALTTVPPTPFSNPVELSEDERNKQVQDLQIALLECAMEYELKTIELKMEIKSLQSTPKHAEPNSKSPCERSTEMLYLKNSREFQIVESMKKQIFKLQREKAALSKEFLILQKKERKFDIQQRNLEDALQRVNRLTKEVVKKDHELLEAQLMEKQTRVQLQETEAALAKAESKHVPPYQTGTEPAKLVAALPPLREWIRTLKKEHSYEPMIVKMVDGYYSPGDEPDHSDALKPPRSTNEQPADNAQKAVEKVVHTLMKEVQALQRELSRLGGCRTLRPKTAPLSAEFLKSTHLKKEQTKK